MKNSSNRKAVEAPGEMSPAIASQQPQEESDTGPKLTGREGGKGRLYLGNTGVRLQVSAGTTATQIKQADVSPALNTKAGP